MKNYTKEIFALGILMIAGALYHGFDLDREAKSVVLTGLPKVVDQLIPEKVEPLMVHPSRAEDLSGPVHPSPVVATPEPLAERLREFSGFQRKALLRDEERLRKQEILEDPEFLRQLGGLLAEQLKGREMEQALDLLLEARRYSEAAVVDEVFKMIVQDSRVEDLSLPYAERERLAEVKAEVMYHWSASDNRISQQISATLPGEVSQRLWRNVTEIQAQNLAESMALQKRFAATGSHLMEAPAVE